MREAAPEFLAPCVAVVGPANSGKTTLLHLLDDALQRHPSAPLAYVVKGNPDGTGRYLFHAPELRESLKERVKGAWHEATVETVCNWIGHCRRQLDLVLVDMGGRHAPGNAAIFGQCTHGLVLARRFDDSVREEAEGMESWAEACHRAGLRTFARLRSAWQEGAPDLVPSADGLSGTFRADASSPGDPTNRAVIDGLAEALLALCGERHRPPYLDLRLGRDWQPNDLPDLAGLAPRLLETVGEGKTLTLGGRAPVWAYGAALHRALDVDPQAVVEVFDPKIPAGLVRIPETLAPQPDPGLAASLSAVWEPRASGDGATLALQVTTPDRFLGLLSPEALAGAPRPAGEPPPGPLVVSGAAPLWLHLTYSRWLRSLPGGRAVGVWDARMRSAVFLAGPGAPSLAAWD